MINELKVVKINEKLTVFFDRSVTFRHGILGSGVSHSDTVFLDWNITFPHSILGSECNIPTQYSWIECHIPTQYNSIKSVTFRYSNIKGKRYWTNLMYSIRKNPFPNEHGVEAWVVVCAWYCDWSRTCFYITCLCWLFLITY